MLGAILLLLYQSGQQIRPKARTIPTITEHSHFHRPSADPMPTSTYSPSIGPSCCMILILGYLQLKGQTFYSLTMIRFLEFFVTVLRTFRGGAILALLKRQAIWTSFFFGCLLDLPADVLPRWKECFLTIAECTKSHHNAKIH